MSDGLWLVEMVGKLGYGKMEYQTWFIEVKVSGIMSNGFCVYCSA